ncbi:amino acid permease [Mycobacterium yunnanensis]|uniref:Amino acid permease n=1 Tax=Mycobacterium yunnanensis TaxID=368477 RepID=A0A9X2YQA4_9MYCO|nr:amino acid permease [Mycobacterium yunnanensis]MCV7423508.1 amino acid permease [Mycobacterium yunnanensis]
MDDIATRAGTSTVTATAPMRREFSMWSAAMLGFVFVSPIVAMYMVFGLGLAAAGPGFWWALLVVLIGQVLIGVTFGVLASRWPMAGGVYQWSRRLLGPAYGWFAGWAYMWTLMITLTAVSYGGALFAAAAFDLDTDDRTLMTVIGMVILAGAVLVNVLGRAAVRTVGFLCLVAEVVGSVGIAFWLLCFHSVNSVATLGNGLTWPSGTAFMATPFVVAIMFAGWSFLGFESASTLAEEVREPQRDIPKAIVGSLVGVGLVVLLTCFAFLMAMPESAAAAADPVAATLTAYLPPPAFKAVMILFVVAYFATVVAVSSAVSRIVWSYGRNGELPVSRHLGRLHRRINTPTIATVVTGAIGILLYLPFQSVQIYTLLVTFVTAGFFLSFAFPIVGLAVAKMRGTWDRSEPTFLGRAGHAAGWLALIWVIAETVNVLWPRTGTPLVDWAPFIVTAALFGIGLAIRTGLKLATPDQEKVVAHP